LDEQVLSKYEREFHNDLCSIIFTPFNISYYTTLPNIIADYNCILPLTAVPYGSPVDAASEMPQVSMAELEKIFWFPSTPLDHAALRVEGVKDTPRYRSVGREGHSPPMR
jgi:hypothetical protein